MRSQSGFTLIELLIIVIIILILAAVALPHYVGNQDKTREASVKKNMRMVQLAAESFANDRGGLYPDKLDDSFFSYFEGGPGDGKSAVGAHGPVNPYTNKPEWPIIGSVNDVPLARSSAPGAVGSAGQIEYSPIVGTDGVRSYAVRGANRNGQALQGTTPMSTFVLSRQN
ncbi:MAG: prepilin-type N-terminal cleavage/methylation domain-containing protein [Cyanobacteria bacterium REEB67]|nr:prepilin-type N-terminal cleavage/methylation domain-containing protein [Cyanobacteria bacterium REEB67]